MPQLYIRNRATLLGSAFRPIREIASVFALVVSSRPARNLGRKMIGQLGPAPSSGISGAADAATVASRSGVRNRRWRPREHEPGLRIVGDCEENPASAVVVMSGMPALAGLMVASARNVPARTRGCGASMVPI